MKRIIGLVCGAFFYTSIVFAQTGEIPSAKPGMVYGKATTTAGAISVKALTQKLHADTNQRFIGKVRGEIMEVCKQKGCYIRLKPEGKGEPIMVRFKDYGFFMPQDALGKTIVLDGQARVRNAAINFIADGVVVAN